MLISRRKLLAGLAASGSLAAARKRSFRIGVTDWNLRLAGKPEAVALAAKLGFEGVEVSLGRELKEQKLPLDSAGLLDRYVAEAKQHRIRLAGTCLDVLHVLPLKSEKISLQYVSDAIRITRRLDAKVVLLPFFGKGSPDTEAEQDYVGDALRELAPEAERAKVKLGLEDQLSARANVRIMERSKSPAVEVYYDVGNSTRWRHDVVAELRWLGSRRICQMHFKEDPTGVRLGQGRIPFDEILKTLDQIGFDKFANLETSSKTEPTEVFMAADLAYIR
ncbi:MAG: sugar phosphate isomerase/epimerase [Acidobacteria bacterium]|nr:sugar phosphate isomerase/epimerase [Acidobacteriota bacterium]